MKGIVFDKDGTLFDFNATWGAWAHQMIAAECAGDAARIAALSDDLGYDSAARVFRPGSIVIAETLELVADRILPHITDPDKDALMTRMKVAATQVPQAEVTPLQPFLAGLRARDIVLGVATNDSEQPARAHLAAAGITEFFAFIAGADSGFGGKPAAGQLRGFCAATDLLPTACAMVGDSLHDLEAGRAAGMTTIGILTGPAPAEELAPLADVILPSIAAIPEWLDRQT